MTVITFSPAEVFMSILLSLTDRNVIPHIVVGPLSEGQQLDGGVSIMDAGAGQEELYLPLVRPRMQLRCIAPSLAAAEHIGRHLGFAIQDYPGRMLGRQASTGEDYLVHTVTGSGGPSAHKDTEGTWEYLVFAIALMGTVPV